MKIDFNRLDDLNAKVSLVIEHADYGPKWEESIRNYSKKVAIKGFRAGKTPKSVLIKMYGRGLLEETVNKLLNDTLFNYLDEQKIGIFGSPIMAEDAEPVDFDPKSTTDYHFEFDLGLKPDFDLQLNHDKPLEVVVPVVDQKAIEEDIIKYRRAFGADTPVTDGKIEEFDKVGLTLKPSSATEGEGVETVVNMDGIQGEGKQALLNLTIGAALDVDLEKFLGYEREGIVKNTLHLEADPSPGESLQYSLVVSSISRPQMTPLTGEQLTKVVGKAMEGEEDFKDFLISRAGEELKNQAVDMKKMAIRLNLNEANPFDMPEDFLFRWVNHQREKKVAKGSREAAQLFRDAKWSLLLNRILDQDNLEVTDKDVQRQVTNWIVQNVNYMQTDIKKLMDELYANEYFMSSMKENALEDVVFKHILEKYEFNEKEVSPKEFEKAFHDIHHQIFDHGDHHHENTGKESEHSHA